MPNPTTVTISPVSLSANTEIHSQSTTLNASVTEVDIHLTDGAGNETPLAGSDWLTTVGTITRWGVQRSTDGGTTWGWYLFQDHLPFGTLTKSGMLPWLRLSSSALIGASGDRLRLAAIVDTPIKLGAKVTFQ